MISSAEEFDFPTEIPNLNEDQIAGFCFPDGVPAQCIRKTDSGFFICIYIYI